MKMTASTSVYITGMAWTTPLGEDLNRVWDRLLAGDTGMVPVPCRGRVRNSLAAVVNSIPLDRSPAERLSWMARDTARRAWLASGREALDPGVPLVIGSSFGSLLEEDMPGTPAGAWAESVALDLGLEVAPLVVSTACSSGSDAILLGAGLIRAGLAPCCLCGGVDVLTCSKRLNHSALGTLSPSLLRAFDVRHDGTLLGEGAGFLVLEGKVPPQGALARLCGGGSASDAAGMTAPDTDGAAVCMAVQRSLDDAGLDPRDIGLISAHASGTPLNDTAEREAFRVLFSDPGTALVFATKANVGHSLGATGAVETIALVLALRTGRVPPVAGLEQPDPEFPLQLPVGVALSCRARVGLSLTLGFGGFDTSLIVEAQP